MRRNRRENSSTPRLIIIIIDIFTRFLRYSSTTPCSFLPTICVVVVVLLLLGCLGFFFFVSSFLRLRLLCDFFLTKKNRHFSSVFLTRRAPKHGAMPIGDGTTVTGTTREEEEDEEEEENDVIIKARRKKAIDDEASTGCSTARRFELDLEFVQSLANPRYLHH